MKDPIRFCRRIFILTLLRVDNAEDLVRESESPKMYKLNPSEAQVL